MISIDVLCIGQASYDITMSVSHHPGEDEKCLAHSRVMGGGGPAANAAVAVVRLGGSSAFVGYLSNDVFGELHSQEFKQEGVNTSGVVRGNAASPLSVILVKPEGTRTVVNDRSADAGIRLPAPTLLDAFRPTVILTDGHEPALSEWILRKSKKGNIPIVLDAGSLHKGTEALAPRVDYLIASRKFAEQYTGLSNPREALNKLKTLVPMVIITLGEFGGIWSQGEETGSYPVFPVTVVDTTGAGDAFHGAFALGLARGYSPEKNIRFAAVAAALTCTKLGARQGLPTMDSLLKFAPEMEKLIHPA